MVRELRKPLTRRIGRLVVQVTSAGIGLRGYRRRKWRRVSWTRIASLVADDSRELIKGEESRLGAALLKLCGADPESLQ